MIAFQKNKNKTKNIKNIQKTLKKQQKDGTIKTYIGEIMKLKENRTASFITIAVIYIIAIMAGVGVYLLLPFANWSKLLIADVIATVVTFVFSLVFKNASVYDPYWSVQPIVILIAFDVGQTMSAIKILLLVVVCLWGIRLTANWAYTFKNLTHQDWRYTMLNQKTGKFYPIINFLGIHLVPTLIVYACILPAVFVFESGAIGNIWSYLAVVLSLCAVALQGTADCQMHKFRKYRTTEKFIRTGLWKHSRHPNYLGEILMWWGVGLASVAALGGQWYLLTGAILNTLLFLFVSIPMADGRQSRKEGFAEYKKQTRMLLPIKKFKKIK